MADIELISDINIVSTALCLGRLETKFAPRSDGRMAAVRATPLRYKASKVTARLHCVFVCRTTRTAPAPAARGPAPRVPDLGLHRPAQLGPTHHPHCRPGLPGHGPQQDSDHWQDQVGNTHKPGGNYHKRTHAELCDDNLS